MGVRNMLEGCYAGREDSENTSQAGKIMKMPPELNMKLSLLLQTHFSGVTELAYNIAITLYFESLGSH